MDNLQCTYLVVGGGIAGVTCVETLAILHPEESLIIVTASSLVKNVSNVSFYAKTIVKFDVDETEATSLKKIHPNLQIVYDSLKHVDTKAKLATTDDGSVIQYQVLCICTGGVPRLISDSKKSKRILGIRDTESVQEFQKRLKDGRKMVIVGNGGIASEIVHATRSIQKVWVIRDDYISATFIDPGAAEFFQNTFKSKPTEEEKPKPTLLRRHVFTEEDTLVSLNKNLKSAALGPDWYRKLEGVKSDTGEQELEIVYKVEINSVTEVQNKEYPLEVELTNGRVIECDFVVSATGVEPAVNFKWDQEPKKGPDGGLAVNEYQETSIRDVFAAGDVAHAAWQHAPHWFQLRLWTQARQMAGMAVKAMHARVTNQPVLQDFCFELFTHCTTLFGYRVILLGKYNGQGLGNDYEILLRTTPNYEYIKFVLHNGQLQGAILIGETDLEEIVVARGTVVLAKYASCAGNFTEVTEQILSKIPPHDDRLTYSHGNYLFHYIAENKLVFFCITDDKFQRSRAFLFLNEIKRRFTTSFGDTAQTAIPYAMNSEFARVLAIEMKHYTESRDLDTISRVHGELDELKNIMVKNIETMTVRGEKLDLLVDKADVLASTSVTYHSSARTLQRTLFWKNIKMYAILALIAALAVYLIGAMACGGLAWKNCVG
ncbi:pyridine nucleotide-disulfide oxidoreductase domain-containing protein [Phthorimaea operculella]|nr:pyridine nucleotide-disulfide oxidoreductase domain-containing protein [Phthorimaea operculella]